MTERASGSTRAVQRSTKAAGSGCGTCPARRAWTARDDGLQAHAREVLRELAAKDHGREGLLDVLRGHAGRYVARIAARIATSTR